ncbi:MAG: hypothetical protein L0Z73_16990 [Gammaproteobacteria bacterium]|nr:hypothetical protein [Gammaproteobacteria bacterium]
MGSSVVKAAQRPAAGDERIADTRITRAVIHCFADTLAKGSTYRLHPSREHPDWFGLEQRTSRVVTVARHRISSKKTDYFYLLLGYCLMSCYYSAMTIPAIPKPVLDAETAAFIRLHVSINLATANSANRAAVTRVYGCRVDENPGGITLFIAGCYNQAVLENIKANGRVAAVFSRP